MIQAGTMVKVVDNTGAKVAKVFKVLGSTRRRYAGVGDMVVITVKVAEPRKPVKTHEVHQAVIVRQKNALRRRDGSYIRFDDNAVVILEKGKKDLKGGRVFGPVPRELGERGFQNIISLAPEVI